MKNLKALLLAFAATALMILASVVAALIVKYLPIAISTLVVIVLLIIVFIHFFRTAKKCGKDD